MTPRAYAESTSVTVEKSRAEIETILMRHGADAFAYSTDSGTVRLGFRMDGRHFRFTLSLPDPKEPRFTHHSRGARTIEGARTEWEQACRQKWRALLLVIKAKLEAVSAGISSIEDEFLANLILPDRQTVSEWLKPQVEEAYRVGSMPTNLMLEGPE